MISVRFALQLMMFAALLGLAGCTELQREARRPPYGNDGPQGAASSSARPLANKPAGETRTTRIKTQVLPLGFIPYDNMTLPLVSPDGRYLATQTGVAPNWDTILARPEADVPYATRIEIYEVGKRWGDNPNLKHALDVPVLLGRACDSDGFLVEAPREDGSRWIGRVNWQTGELRWLINDNAVNAFAILGPAGRIAWSRRAVEDEHFDLVIRRDSLQFTIESTGNDWLMPTWSGRDDGLFVLSLSKGFLDLSYAVASTPRAFEQSIQKIVLKRSSASHREAYQTLANHVTVAVGSVPAHDEVTFFNPPYARTVIWRPLSGGAMPMTILCANSYAAVATGDGHALTATEEALFLQNLTDLKDTAELMAGVLVPRLTPLGDWPFLLLETEEGRVALTALRLLPHDADVEELLKKDAR